MFLSRYSQLHVISDLHLGGVSGFQMFNEGELLASWIHSLTTQKVKKSADPIGLVLNGDVVDFLAEPNATYLNPVGATDCLDRIRKDKAFTGVFEALAKFVDTERRRLVIVLGNHDVELALPHVQAWLTDALAGGKPERIGRISFATDGAGYLCNVGEAKVLCLHGNEADTFNAVDHLQVAQTSRALSRCQAPPSWVPNAGTQLVIDLMNDLKKEFPFVDLLKPEMMGVVPLLLALRPSLAARIPRMGAVAKAHARYVARDIAGLLDEGAGGLQLPMDAHTPHSVTESDLIRAANERSAAAESSSHDSLHEEGSFDEELFDEELLGIVDSVAGWTRQFKGMARKAALRQAWEMVLPDLPANGEEIEDSTFRKLDRLVGDDVHVVIAGHTHQRKCLERRGGGAYINTGTWARLIQLDRETVRSNTLFDSAFAALSAGTMEALDAHPTLVNTLPGVATVAIESDAVTASLGHPRLKGNKLGVEVLRELKVELNS